MTAQALALVTAPSRFFGDATSMNVVYSSRTVERGSCLVDRTLVCQYGAQDGPTGNLISVGGSLAHDLCDCRNFSWLILQPIGSSLSVRDDGGFS